MGHVPGMNSRVHSRVRITSGYRRAYLVLRRDERESGLLHRRRPVHGLIKKVIHLERYVSHGLSTIRHPAAHQSAAAAGTQVEARRKVRWHGQEPDEVPRRGDEGSSHFCYRRRIPSLGGGSSHARGGIASTHRGVTACCSARFEAYGRWSSATG
jgi:hypothetical protein